MSRYNPTVENILSVYQLSENNAAKYWYVRAHGAIRFLSMRFSVTVRQSAFVVSALSVRNSWVWDFESRGNLKSAYDMMAAWKRGETIDDFTVTTFNHAKKKAWAVLTQSDWQSLFDKSVKQRNFGELLINPNSAEFIAIDGHAAHIARMGAVRIPLDSKSAKMTANQYRQIAALYSDAANQVGMLPSQLQAITWENYRAL